MKAYELAKRLYPELSMQDFIQQTCPDKLLITNKAPDCCKENRKSHVCADCLDCWNQEISEERANWLIQAKKIGEHFGV